MRVPFWNTEPGKAWNTAEAIVSTIIHRRTPKRDAIGGVTADAAKKPIPVARAQMPRSLMAASTSVTVWKWFRYTRIVPTMKMPHSTRWIPIIVRPRAAGRWWAMCPTAALSPRSTSAAVW